MTAGRAASWYRFSPAAFWRRRLSPWRTRRLLEVHLVVLFLLTAVASTALFLSCRQVQHSAEALASREAPAVQGLAATRLAALRADQEVSALVDMDLIDVTGSGEAYRSQLSAADQGLSRIADRTDQDLGTVKGLLATYSDSLGLGTSPYPDQSLMRKQKLQEAESLLTRESVGLVPRLEALQGVQLKHAEATATMGQWQRGGWWLAELSLALVGLTLLSALFVLRDRCGRDWNPYLLAAFVLTVLLAVFPLTAMSSTQDALGGAVKDLRQITYVPRQSGTEPADAQQYVTKKSEQVRQKMTDDAWTAPVYQGAFVGSLLAVVLPALGLGLRLDNDYWR
ncbi:hypothetical protein JL475_35630 [Streptomyces sp. M2CJ-2]|uniref:hypothetical protein n=1 Tax=Streptomyces sp. M2CJ-2 TaxID=2803948 RepID=UPI00192958FA|nr:hypothetical protein [Streptomyces sp. M2CJ-2]MBL3671168.1 hypothetical protein [Streptomyces sp. M2CJ-2]